MKLPTPDRHSTLAVDRYKGDKLDRQSIIAATLLGAASGIRSMTPPATVSWTTVTGRWSRPGTPLAGLDDPKVALALTVAAAGEIIADKLPITPPRTIPASWLWRVAMGGLAGGAATRAIRRQLMPGVVVGAGTAAASTYLSYRARMALEQQLSLPNALAGVLGDLEAVGLSLAAVLLVRRPPRRRLARVLHWVW